MIILISLIIFVPFLMLFLLKLFLLLNEKVEITDKKADDKNEISNNLRFNSGGTRDDFMKSCNMLNFREIKCIDSERSSEVLPKIFSPVINVEKEKKIESTVDSSLVKTSLSKEDNDNNTWNHSSSSKKRFIPTGFKYSPKLG